GDVYKRQVLLHEVYMNHGLTEEAEKAMRQAVEIDPQNQDYMKYLVQALEKNGKKEEANEILKKLLKSESDPWFVYASIAKNYEELGLLDSAKMIMEQFASSHPGDRRAKIYLERLNNLIKNSNNIADTFKKSDSVAK
ncbi:MAG: tetratricopeptide repeat protein, partial [Chitinispirillaceae bacterium]|nr:tetratricopeptide repeat protein [Chitinispirillaceae bacterium]